MPDEPLWIATPVEWREACFSLPATRALAARHEVKLCCPSQQVDFWKAAGFDEIHEYDPKLKPRVLTGSLPSMKRCLLWEDGTAAQAIHRASVPERIGLPSPKLSKILTEPLELKIKPGPPEHRVKRYLDTARILGAGPLGTEHFTALSPSVPREASSLLIAPESNFGRHYEWPLERWIELLEKQNINARNTRVLGNGPLAKGIEKAVELQRIDSLEPLQFAAFEKCLSAESENVHLAATFGVTCAVLYGPGDPELTRPLGRKHLAIRHKVECSPCLSDRCPLDHRCQSDLRVGRVATLLGDFLNP